MTQQHNTRTHADKREIKEFCAWSQDGDSDSDTWATDCRQYFSINEGTPSDNDFKFCCYCGKPIQEFKYEEDTL